MIALTEIKGYAMIQFAYMIKRLHGEGNFTIGNTNFNIKMREPSRPKIKIFAADRSIIYGNSFSTNLLPKFLSLSKSHSL